MGIVILILQVILLNFREFHFSLPVKSKLIFIFGPSVSTFSCTFIVMNRDSGLLFKILAALNCGRILLLCLIDIRVDHVTCFGQWSVNRSLSCLSEAVRVFFSFLSTMIQVLSHIEAAPSVWGPEWCGAELKPTYWTWIVNENNSLFLLTNRNHFVSVESYLLLQHNLALNWLRSINWNQVLDDFQSAMRSRRVVQGIIISVWAVTMWHKPRGHNGWLP